ncbi:sugar ABC transporter ATP-binding protein [Rhizobium sp. 16-449-1b]|uniref:ATP-binding cassette domain-containing protein n=1 Tax=Rhizobium sp. 16-449-1b TaxID=2819989 RepID=UPI001ADB0D62|nr:ATP-binding cassette domain-containing protein [Rhizobium sp. 16-449-1b]MBO9195105.1 sugar ABC transporter ATP-binding protein [Rhizobium sp. 16-449-1b]
MTDSNTPLVEMRGISKAFGGVQAVDDVSLTVGRGEVVGLLGHNGAGKSTLIKILAGAYVADSGEIKVNGDTAPIADPMDAKAHGIETIYQNLALADNLDAVGNLFLGREIRKYGWMMDRKAMKDATATVCAQVNPRFKNLTVPVRYLSGGQRQSIAIARAIYFNAKVIIMDEPTAALGPGETALVKELVHRLKAQGVGVILISHDIEDVFELADRLVVMAAGRVVGNLKTEEATRKQVLSLIIMGDGSHAD